MESRKRRHSSNASNDDVDVSETKQSSFELFLDARIDSASCSSLKMPKKTRKLVKYNLPELGSVALFSGVTPLEIAPSSEVDLSQLGWPAKLIANYNALAAKSKPSSELLSIIGQYVDLHAITAGIENYRLTYAAHVISHLMQSRNKIIANDKILKTAQESGDVKDSLIETLRDQGYVRPTVLILAPFRKDAYEIVHQMIELIFKDNRANVGNRKRFDEEFGDSGYRVSAARQTNDDFKNLMEGNVDDCFRIGIAFSKKEFKLYSAFEKSDIILCSPLGLRMVLNGEAGDDSHIISSIQIAIVDKCEILLQQNWEHVVTALRWLNETPKKIEADIRRVRTTYIDGLAPFYCQTLLFSSYQHELFTSLASQYSLSHKGLILHQPVQNGILSTVCRPLCQELHRIAIDNAEVASDARFNYFKDKILPKLELHTLIFIPSYFDYVRVRNYLNKLPESFVQCNEYAANEKIDRARDMFYHGRKKLLLITERFHFYKRFHIRGAKSVVFYQLPNEPTFYSDIINMASPEGSRLKATLPFTKFDRLRLANVFGKELAASILASSKQVQAIVSG